jgi:hypothetical protein
MEYRSRITFRFIQRLDFGRARSACYLLPGIVVVRFRVLLFGSPWVPVENRYEAYDPVTFVNQSFQ